MKSDQTQRPIVLIFDMRRPTQRSENIGSGLLGQYNNCVGLANWINPEFRLSKNPWIQTEEWIGDYRPGQSFVVIYTESVRLKHMSDGPTFAQGLENILSKTLHRKSWKRTLLVNLQSPTSPIYSGSINLSYKGEYLGIDSRYLTKTELLKEYQQAMSEPGNFEYETVPSRFAATPNEQQQDAMRYWLNNGLSSEHPVVGLAVGRLGQGEAKILGRLIKQAVAEFGPNVQFATTLSARTRPESAREVLQAVIPEKHKHVIYDPYDNPEKKPDIYSSIILYKAEAAIPIDSVSMTADLLATGLPVVVCTNWKYQNRDRDNLARLVKAGRYFKTVSEAVAAKQAGRVQPFNTGHQMAKDVMACLG